MDRFDVLFALGVLLISIGAGLMWFPLGLVCGGTGIIVIAVIGAQAAAAKAGAARAAAPKDKA